MSSQTRGTGSVAFLSSKNGYMGVLNRTRMQVLYARDARGTVVARQLVAISREGYLICFGVYPRSASAAVKALFRDHDVDFAAALGVPLHGGERDERDYVIDFLISSEWWNDGFYADSPRPSR
jgi:hypothetical protein